MAPIATDTLLDRVSRLDEQHKEVLNEIRKSRDPRRNQPAETIRRFANTDHDTSEFRQLTKACFPGGLGEFMWQVSRCPGENLPGWNQNEKMNAYMTKSQQLLKALPTGMNLQQLQDGGVLVPPEYVNQLLMRTYQNDLLSRTTMLPMTTSNQLKIPAVNETSRADGSRFGGVQAYFDGESDTINLTKTSLGQVTLTANRLTMAIRATQELMDDQATIETWLNVIADQEMAFKIGDKLVNGTGAGMPLGIANALSLVTIAKETGQAAATLVTNNILKMWARLHVSCRANAIWVYDQSIEPQLQVMTIGTAGAQLASYLPPGGLSGAMYGTLMGRPMIPVEFCSQLGTVGDLYLFDPSTILGAMKGGLQAANSIHVYFLSNEQVFRFVMRMDARSWWTSALTPKSAGDTQTNILALATRS